MAAMQGVYKPKNKEKYKGDVNNIVYRSSWELTYLRRLDTDDNVLEYSSEEVIIPYRCPIHPTKVRRYFVDFWVRRKTKDGVVEELIEIKPDIQTRPPKITNKKGKRVLKEAITYATNEAKWDAAQKYCDKKGWYFRVITEKELYGR